MFKYYTLSDGDLTLTPQKTGTQASSPSASSALIALVPNTDSSLGKISHVGFVGRRRTIVGTETMTGRRAKLKLAKLLILLALIRRFVVFNNVVSLVLIFSFWFIFRTCFILPFITISDSL